MISNAFDFPILLVPLNRIRIPNIFLEITEFYELIRLQFSKLVFLFPQDIRTYFYHVIGHLAISLKYKNNKKQKS
jgi:hypothetical protein